MKLLSLLRALPVLMLLAASNAFATAQLPDVLLFEGHEEQLYTNPLQPWLEKHPDALPGNLAISSNNWRGYIATWEIAGDQLVLKKIDVGMTGSGSVEGKDRRNIIADVFPRMERAATDWSSAAETGKDAPTGQRNILAEVFSGTQGVVADWYSGTLIIPQGELLSYVHLGYGSTYQFYQLFTVRNGRVVQRTNLAGADFIDYRKKQFAAFRKTDAFKAQLKALLKDAKGAEEEEQVIAFLFDIAAEQYLSHDYATDAPPQGAATPGGKP